MSTHIKQNAISRWLGTACLLIFTSATLVACKAEHPREVVAQSAATAPPMVHQAPPDAPLPAPNAPEGPRLEAPQPLGAYLADLNPTDEQRLAVRQVEQALLALAAVNVENATDLEVAVADVVAGSKCMRHVFTGHQEKVPQVITYLVLATPELRTAAEQAYAAFDQNPNLGPLNLLEPAGSGCDSEPPSITEDAPATPSEVYFDNTGRVMPAPEPSIPATDATRD